MSAPRYPSYKKSGVAWLGQVPTHWQVRPFKWEIDRNDGGVWGDDPDGVDDTIVLRSTEQTVDGRWRMDDPAPRKLSPTERAAALLAEGDLVVTKSSGSSLHIGKTTIATAEIAASGCCYSNFMQRVRTKATFLPKLAWYVLNNDLARLQFDLASNSTTGLANLNGTMIGGIVLPVAPVDEQAAIVIFLDREAAKIDALVEEQRRLIELLKEKRQAVISQAVTKGLKPNLPMKDSGVEWLGKVPAHWQLVELKYLCSRISSGKTPSGGSETYVDDGVTFLRSQNVHDDGLQLEDVVYIDGATDAAMASSRALAGDILLNITGASIGRTCKLPEPFPPANVNQHVCVLRPKDASAADFLAWFLKSPMAKMYMACIQNGAARDGLNFEQIGNLLLALPAAEERTLIATHLSQQYRQLGELIGGAEESVALLDERRSALISAAVTGKIDVRGLVPQPEAIAA